MEDFGEHNAVAVLPHPRLNVILDGSSRPSGQVRKESDAGVLLNLGDAGQVLKEHLLLVHPRQVLRHFKRKAMR